MVAKSHPLTPSQLAAIAALDDSDPSNVPKAISYLPTSVYASQEYFELEQRKLFRGRPVPLEVSAALPNPKMHVINEDYGTPVLLTRDDEGLVHAFVNVCRHRSIQLSQEKEAKSGGLIVCQYHAWSFNLKGDLVGVPRQESFPGLDKKEHGLVRLECKEAGGIIWVNLDPDTQADFSVVSGELDQELRALGLHEQVVYRKERFELAANWKLVHDAFLENYHIARLHSKSLGGMFVDRTTVCDEIGPHIRHLSARASYKSTDGEAIKTFEEFRELGVFCYTLLPGCIVINSPTYINVMFMSPQAPGKTVINYYMLVDRMPETEAEIKRCERSVELMMRVTTEEDFWVATLGTIGAATGAVKQMVLGGMEQEVARFHRILDEELGK
jgi:phenylpropionate dioxygenase-like ring-hydroxylating dioxygenase large terminal subunit